MGERLGGMLGRRRARAVGWGLIAAGTVVLWAVLAREGGGAEAAPAVAIALGIAAGLVLEVLLLLIGPATSRGGRRRASSPPARAADGLVEVLPLAGAVGEPLGVGMPWRRFGGLDPGDPGALARGGRQGGEFRILGQVALVSVFVGQDGRRWSAREIRDAHESLRAAALWVEREAAARGAPVNVGLADTFFEAEDVQADPVELAYVGEGDGFGPMEADSPVKALALASRVAAALGFADVADLVARADARVEADACVWLLHLRRRGRSHAIPAGDGFVDGVGLAVCYAREASFPEPLVGPARVDPTTVVHELLHLGGATDKYGVPLASFPAGSVPRRDVMRLDEERLDRLTIGRLTASELGWGDG